MIHRAVQITRDLVSIPSVNPMGKGLVGEMFSERNVALYIVAFLEKLGIKAALGGADPNHPFVIAFIDGSCDETVMLEAHMDTVSHERMTIAPFDPIIENGLLYGRGSCDTKASLATYLYAIEHIITSGKKLNRNILFTTVHDEEYSFLGAQELVQQGIKATFAIAGEPTSLNIIHAHKGICRFYMTTQGKSVHAALPWLGVNAIYKMARAVVRIEEYGQALLQQKHPVLGPAAINVGRMIGGEAVNIVPPHCMVEIDRRLLPGQDFALVKAELLAIMEECGVDVTIDDPYLVAESVYNPIESHACQTLLRACQSCGIASEFQTAHYGTDASFYAKAGIPTVVFGPGSIAQAHTKDEFVPVADVEKAAEIIVALLTNAD